MLRPPLAGALALSLAFPLAAQVELQTLVPELIEAGDGFGSCLSVDGRLAAISSRRDPFPAKPRFGTVHLYERGPDGWGETDRLRAPGTTKGTFGVSLALSGERLLVGSYRHTRASGPAFLYERGPAGWQLVRELDIDEKQAFDTYSFSVALDGDTAVVGRPKDSTFHFEGGSVHVFEPHGPRWRRTARLYPSDAAAEDRFGHSIAIDGDDLLVSAYWAGPGLEGKAYFFERDAAGAWHEVAVVEGDGLNSLELFGHRVALEGGIALIGAPESGQDAGKVWVFERRGAWVRTAILQANDGALGDRFGIWVDLLGDVAVVGAPGDDDHGADSGAVYVFERAGGSWAQTAKLARSAGAAGDWLGRFVGLSLAGVLASAPWGESTAHDAGATIAYELAPYASADCFGAACPCANEDPAGGCASSLGRGARLAAGGGASVTADALFLRATELPPHRPVVLLMGDGAPSLPAGDGRLCVGAGTLGSFRFSPAVDSGAGGTAGFGPGLVAHSRQRFAPEGAILAGQTWRFQAVFGDPGGPCSTGVNATHALAVTFAP